MDRAVHGQAASASCLAMKQFVDREASDLLQGQLEGREWRVEQGREDRLVVEAHDAATAAEPEKATSREYGKKGARS